MKFHKEGWTTLFVALAIGATLTLAGYFWLGSPFLEIFLLLAVFILILVLQFFRNPFRHIAEEDLTKVYAPADGKVVVVEKTFEAEYLKRDCWQVSIFMSPINVHVNRNPVAGEVEYLKYHPGKYLAAWNPKSSLDNERFTTVYRTGSKQVLMRQIAGALARRIVNYLETGQKVRQGHEMGFIKFGSRVDLFLPADADIKVRPGQVVVAPLDVIAEL